MKNRRDVLRGMTGVALTGLAGCIGTSPLAEDGAEKAETTAKSTVSSGSESGETATVTQHAAETGLGVGEKPPNFTLQTTAGTDVSLHPVEKPTVLFFMAAWCASCKQEESNLNQVFRRYGDEVRLISVDVDPDRDTMEDLRRFKRQYGGDWPHAMGTRELIREYRVTSLDTTYVIDQTGVTAFKDSSVTAIETFEREVKEVL